MENRRLKREYFTCANINLIFRDYSKGVFNGCRSSPFITFLAFSWTLSSMSASSHLYWEAHNWTQWSRCVFTTAEKMGRIPSHHLLTILFVIQQRIPINFFAIMMLCWFTFKLVTLCFPVLNVMRFLLVPFSRLLRMETQHSGVSGASPSFDDAS